MSTRTDHLMKALRTLPYSDMIKVAQALSEELKGIHSAHHLADALVNVQAKFVDGDKLDAQEDEALREMVGTRSRGFDVKVRRVGAMMAADEIERLRRELAEVQTKYGLLSSAINESTDECGPDCDDYGHGDKCPSLDPERWLIDQQATIEGLRRELAEVVAV